MFNACSRNEMQRREVEISRKSHVDWEKGVEVNPSEMQDPLDEILDE